jgi:2-keto-3-deoxy-L-rhamnonate aldolase RhmA
MGNSTSGSGVVNRNLKTKLERGEPAYGLWVTLESPAVTEIATELQLDFVVIELEHSALGANDVVNHLNAARGGKTTVLARLPVGSRESIKIALDIGVDGVIVPLVRSAAQVEEILSFAYYPPKGQRTIGGTRASRYGIRGREHFANANDDILVIPIIETVEALEDIDKILAVPGLEAIFIGPSDLSAAQGHVAVWEGPGVADQILSICQAAREQGIAYGIITLGPEDLKLRREQGYQMLAFGMDTAILVSGIRAALAAAGVGSDSSPHVSGGYGVAAAAAPE